MKELAPTLEGGLPLFTELPRRRVFSESEVPVLVIPGIQVPALAVLRNSKNEESRGC
jgi:hypothetical protein